MKGSLFGWKGKSIPRHVWVLIAIVAVGVFLRSYHFGEWLQFKGDAFRDATLVSNAYREGVESLPLLGPRAGGTMLRLGPIFYYFQYLSASIFQSMSAPVLAYPDFLFSVLSIPMLFLFVRRYFSRWWSLALSAMLAVSFLAVEYGRFAWNPNSTLFFTLLFSYAVLRVFDANEKRRVVFAAIAGAAIAIASQLHFSAFLGLPIVLGSFFLIRFRDAGRFFSKGVVVAFFATALVMYAPVIMSEIFKHGENSMQFLSAISEKSSDRGMTENVFLAAIIFAKYFARIAIGVVEPGRMLAVLGGFLGVAGFFANVGLFRGEKDPVKRDFLLWTILFMVVYGLLYVPLAEKIDRPRFFLPLLVMPFIFFAYVVVFLRERTSFRWLSIVIATLGVGLMLFGNIRSVSGWFSELRDSQQAGVRTEEKTNKGRSFWLTWWHFERTAAIIEASCEPDRPVALFIGKSVREYGHSFEYALLEGSVTRPVLIGKNYDGEGPDGCLYFVALSFEALPVSVAAERSDPPVIIGNLQLIRLYPTKTTAEVVPERKVADTGFVPEKRTRNSRVYWGDIFDLMIRK